jgi:hypothetical protein
MSNGIHMKATYTRTRSAGAEDVAVTTHDLWWDGSGDGTDALCDTIAAAYLVFWNNIIGPAPASAFLSNAIRLTELRFYRGYNGDGSPGEVDYVKTYSVAGTGTAGMCPPQVSCTVTEIVDSRRHWGRFYIPGIHIAALSLDGTLAAARVTQLADAAQTLYQTWGAVTSLSPIVWARHGSAISYAGVAPPRWRPTWSYPSGTVWSTPAALNVQNIRVDEILDIQRPRRYQSTQNRATRVLV